MPPQMMARLKAAGTQINGMTLGQKVVAVIGIGVLLLGGSAFFTWASKPDYVAVYSGGSDSDASAINEALTGAGITTQLQDGAVLVPSADKEQARLDIAAAGLPKGQASGYALLDAEGVTSSQFQQKVTYQRAIEGELASTIEGIDGVDTAVVHLAVPEQTVFTDSKGTTTASVLVSTRSGTELTDEQVNTIIGLVSSSVPDLAKNQVTVSDSTGRLLSSAGQGATGNQDDRTAGYESDQASNIQKMLDTVLGTGKSMATVNATLDFDAVSTATTTYTNSGALPLHSSSSNETLNGSGTGTTGGSLGCNGVLGTDTTGAACTGASGTTTGTGNGYVKKNDVVDNAVNTAVEQRVAAPGKVERQSVAVVVDQTALAAIGADNLKTMVASAAGADTTRGDVVTVTPANFSTTAADAAAKDLAAAKAQQAQEAQVSLIKQGAIGLGVLVLLIVLLVAWRRAMKKGARQPVDLGALERLYPEGASVQLAPAGAAASIAGYAAPPADGYQLVAPEPEPEALRRQEFGQLVDAQPTEVANLLRGWLAASKKG